MVEVRTSSNVLIQGFSILPLEGGVEAGIDVWWDSVNCTITDNNILNFSTSNHARNLYGITTGGNGNKIFRNNISRNDYGLVFASQMTFAYYNNFVNNSQQVLRNNVGAQWNDDADSTGNYWSDFARTDSNGDGIGDKPYTIDSANVDNHPLMSPYWYWISPNPLDMNRDMKGDMKDVAIAVTCYGSRPSDPKWNLRADVTSDGMIDVDDLVQIATGFSKYYS